MYGLFSASPSAFHSVPSRLLSSELCIRGFSCASSLRRCLDHTIKAFIGRLIWSGDLDMLIVISTLRLKTEAVAPSYKFCVSAGKNNNGQDLRALLLSVSINNTRTATEGELINAQTLQTLTHSPEGNHQFLCEKLPTGLYLLQRTERFRVTNLLYKHERRLACVTSHWILNKDF